ncbi:MAG: toprim domain-containing protein, partial [Phycisphaerales bacterium JB038]
LNVEKARIDKILAFEEIRTIIRALECGIGDGEDFDISKLRYGKVIIMTDADVDGSHIRTLLLTFFFRQMPQLIKRGRLFIAQPPLYKIARGKKSRYVLDEGEMAQVLTDNAMETATLVIRNDEGEVVRRLSTDDSRRVDQLLARLRELVTVVERRGLLFTDLLAARDADPEGLGRLPSYRIQWQDNEVFCWSETHAKETLRETGLTLGELTANGIKAGDQVAPHEPASMEEVQRRAKMRELHENREIARLAKELAGFDIHIEDYDLKQEESVTGELLPARYAWAVPGKRKSDEGDEDAGPAEQYVEAPNIPAILESLHEVGSRGLEIKRFKGLGEMNPEELWETTMNPETRKLLQVTWDVGSEAESLFSVLMGDNVEQRRRFIEDHALEVKNLDV